MLSIFYSFAIIVLIINLLLVIKTYIIFSMKKPKTINTNELCYIRYDGPPGYVAHWGPFYTFKSAFEWSRKVYEEHGLDCSIIPVHHPDSHPKTWGI